MKFRTEKNEIPATELGEKINLVHMREGHEKGGDIF
jgi:hypothetical protein